MSWNPDLRLLYQITIEDIRYAKDRQWKIIYYSLLTFAAIIGFYFAAEDTFFSGWGPKLVLVVLALFVSLVAVHHLTDSQKCLCEYRMRIEAIKNGFKKKNPPKPTSILEISIKSDSPYRIFSVIVFLLMLADVICAAYLVLYDEWSRLMLAILIYLALIARYIFSSCKSESELGETKSKFVYYWDLIIYPLFCSKLEKPKSKLKVPKDKHYRFGYYFWDLIFPFIILIMVGALLVAWLLLNRFHLWEIVLLISLAGAAGFIPCYKYENRIVKKAVATHMI